MLPAVTALVPLKALDAAKGRLAPALPSPARRELAWRMAAAVCDACAASPAIAAVVLLAGDDAAATVAEGRDVTVRRSPTGLAATLDDADAAMASVPGSLVVAADLPGVRPEELTALVAAAGDGPAVVLAPTLDGGTGALLRRPPTIIPPAFGPGSGAAHRAAAEGAGVRLVRWWSPTLGHDVDEPGDLARVRASTMPAGRLPAGATRRGDTATMAQGTVKHFDPDTATGTVLTDDETEVVVDAATFANSGLEELRIGQRVRLEIADDASTRATRISLVSM